MARKNVPVATISHYSLTAIQPSTVSTVGNGFVILNDGATFLVLDNTASATVANVTITLASGADVNLTVGPRTYIVPALSAPLTGFFPIRNYGPQILLSADVATLGVQAYSFSATGAVDF